MQTDITQSHLPNGVVYRQLFLCLVCMQTDITQSHLPNGAVYRQLFLCLVCMHTNTHTQTEERRACAIFSNREEIGVSS
ncbi:unnamed protein product [Prunus brigantina]